MKNNVPIEGSSQWKKNEKIINENPTLKKARDKSEGFNTANKNYGASHGGKGSSYRPVNKQQFNDNWDKIFGKKDKDNE